MSRRAPWLISVVCAVAAGCATHVPEEDILGLRGVSAEALEETLGVPTKIEPTPDGRLLAWTQTKTTQILLPSTITPIGRGPVIFTPRVSTRLCSLVVAVDDRAAVVSSELLGDRDLCDPMLRALGVAP